MEKIVVTQEMLQNASDYIPLAERQAMIEQIAQDCIAKVRMGYIPTGGTEERPMPERYQENRLRTSLYLMGVLVVKYLNVKTDWADESLMMPANIYDDWCGSHVLNQIECFRSDKALRDKAFNLLADFRDFRSSLYREIETLLGHHNDVVWRLIDAMGSTLQEQAQDAMGDLLQPGAEPGDLTDEEKGKRLKETEQQLDNAITKLKEMRDKLNEAKEAAKGV